MSDSQNQRSQIGSGLSAQNSNKSGEKQMMTEDALPAAANESNDSSEPKLNFSFDQAQASFFSEQKREEIAQNLDAYIDDPELLTSKKALIDKFTPMSVINSLKGKIKDHGITSRDGRRKDPATLSTDLFKHTILIERLGVSGTAEEPSKKGAQQRASQLFLKQLFPAGTSWLQMINIIQNDKDRLASIMEGKGS